MSTVTELQGGESQGGIRQTETLHMRLPSNLQSTHSANAQATQRRNRIKLDPLRALEPARKKLATIEAQRVMCVLEETKKRCDLVAILPHVLLNIAKYESILGTELMALLNDHKKLFDNFATLEQAHSELNTRIEEAHLQTSEEMPSIDDLAASPHSQSAPQMKPTPPSSRPPSGLQRNSRASPGVRTSSRNSPTGEPENLGTMIEQLDMLINNLNIVKLQLEFSIKNLMRVFSLNPAIVNMILQEVGNLKSKESAFLGHNLNELKEILMGKLLMTPIEEHEKMHYLAQVSAQERSNAAVISKLEEELRLANADKEHETRLKNDVIRKLQNDLHMLEKATEEEIRRTRTEAEKQEAADTKNSEGKRQKLLTELNQLKAQLQNLTTEHREDEQALRRKKWKVETEVENWIQKYDQEMGEKQDEFEEIDAVYTEEKKQLGELEERFKTLETEYKSITEDRNKAKEKREAAEREMALMIKAATTIQAVWRSYKVRKALKAKNKKGKKGKKGK